MTLTFRDKIILLVLIFGVCIYGGYKVLWVPGIAKVTALEEKKQSVENLAGDLEPLLKETEKLKKAEKEAKESVNNIKSLSGGLTATNEEFLVFLGDSAKENNVMVSGFNELGTEVKDGIYRTILDFELKGNGADINKVLEDINNMGIKCSFGSVSYRQNEAYNYLKRFFDDLSELPWYKEEEPEADDKRKQEEIYVETPAPDDTEKQPAQEQPSAEPDIPEQPTEPVITPEPETKQPESIEDRLNNLLKETSYRSNKPYRIVFLNNTQSDLKTEYKAGQQMRLNVTVCLIMYNEPTIETSFLNKNGA